MGCCETKDSHEFIFKEASVNNFKSNQKEKDAYKFVFDENKSNPRINNTNLKKENHAFGDYLSDFDNNYSNNEQNSKRQVKRDKNEAFDKDNSKEEEKYKNEQSNQQKNSAYNRVMNFSFQNGSMEEINSKEQKEIKEIIIKKKESNNNNNIDIHKENNQSKLYHQYTRGKSENIGISKALEEEKSLTNQETPIKKKISVAERCQMYKNRIAQKNNDTPAEIVERVEKGINNDKYRPIIKAKSITKLANLLQEQMLKGPNTAEKNEERISETTLAINQKPVIHKKKKKQLILQNFN